MVSRHDPEVNAASRRITIVVPIYGDWPSLKNCVASLIAHADPGQCDVLLVNDCGPSADEIEAGILGMIYGKAMFTYARNSENIGFVQTCNRAVFELDVSGNDILLLNSDTVLTAGAVEEMRAVLDLSEHHGVVCPRSNDATIATVPFFQRERNADRSMQRSHAVFSTIASDLPQYYVAPVAIGFCFLVRRSLIDNYGFFDVVFGRGYNEENDFCLRINTYGYSALIANHSFVFHVGSTSFGSEQRANLEATNSRVLHDRYGYYPEIVRSFIRNDYSAVDRFADLIVTVENNPKPKILVDLDHLTMAHDGSARNADSFLAHLSSLGEDLGADITIAAQPAAVEFFNLRRYSFPIVDPETIDEVFDVGVAIAPVTRIEQLIRLNRYCLRWVVTYLDVIALRSWELRSLAPGKPAIVRLALEHADSVVAISRTTLADASDFFQSDFSTNGDPARIRVIYQGAALTVEGSQASEVIPPSLKERGYVLVVGNRYPHKQVAEAISALEGTFDNVIALGDSALRERFPWATVLVGGSLSDADLRALYTHADAVVFPSAYEGFGLPLVEAAQFGKPVIAFNTEVSREVVTQVGLPNVTFFQRFSALSATVKGGIDGHKAMPLKLRTIDTYNSEVWSEVMATSRSEVDKARLGLRDRTVRDLTLVWEPIASSQSQTQREISEILASRSFRMTRNALAAFAPVRRAFGFFRR